MQKILVDMLEDKNEVIYEHSYLDGGALYGHWKWNIFLPQIDATYVVVLVNTYNKKNYDRQVGKPLLIGTATVARFIQHVTRSDRRALVPV